MAKTTAWLVTLLGVLAIPPIMAMFTANMFSWIVAIILLIIGITKLTRNYSKRKR